MNTGTTEDAPQRVELREEVEKLEALLAKMTPGPLEVVKGVSPTDDMRCGIAAVRGDRSYMVATIENGAPGDFCETEQSNAEGFVAAVNALPALIAHYRATAIRQLAPQPEARS